MSRDGEFSVGILVCELFDCVVGLARDGVVGVVEALVNFAVSASERSDVVDELEIHVFDPVEVVVCSAPCHHDCLRAGIIPHKTLDLCSCALDYINLSEMGSGFAQGAVPVLDLGVSAVGYY